MSQQLPETLHRAYLLLKEGRAQEAQPVLIEFLKRNPDSEQGWMLLSHAVENPQHKVECLQRVLQINPHHARAQNRIENLTAFQESGEVVSTPQWPTLDPAVPQSTEVTTPTTQGMLTRERHKEAHPRKARPLITPLDVVAITTILCMIVGTAGLYLRNQRGAAITSLPEAGAAGQVYAPPANKTGPRVGYFAPNFTLTESVSGEQVNLGNYVGRPMLVFFWATWCGYCQEEMPSIQAIYERYQEQDFIVLGIDVGESKSKVRSFGNENDLTFPLLVDSRQDVAGLYGITAFPTNVFIGEDGVITYIQIGMMSKGDIDAQVLKNIR